MQGNLLYQCTGLHDNYTQQRPEFPQIHDKDRLQLIFGHHLYEEMLKQVRRPTFLFTGLREPLDRMRSDLNYNSRLSAHLGKTFDVDGYIGFTKNPTCNFIIDRFPQTAGTQGSLAERAMRVLEYFHFVYFPETFPELCANVVQALNLPPVTKKENVSQTSACYEIDPKNFSEDIAMYAEAYRKWGPNSSVRGSARADENIAELRKVPIDMDALRRFFYKMTYYEYKHWNVLGKVVDARKALIAELAVELDYYESMAKRNM